MVGIFTLNGVEWFSVYETSKGLCYILTVDFLYTAVVNSAIQIILLNVKEILWFSFEFHVEK